MEKWLGTMRPIGHGPELVYVAEEPTAYDGPDLIGSRSSRAVIASTPEDALEQAQEMATALNTQDRYPHHNPSQKRKLNRYAVTVEVEARSAQAARQLVQGAAQAPNPSRYRERIFRTRDAAMRFLRLMNLHGGDATYFQISKNKHRISWIDRT